MGRPFSVLFAGLAAVVLLTGAVCAGMRQTAAQPAFFSMIFPQLMPEWAWDAPQERVTPDEALPFDERAPGEAVRL